MNTILLLVATRPWHASTARALLTRGLLAVAVLSVEMQAVTWAGVGSLRTLVAVNAALAVSAWLPWPQGATTDGPRWSGARRAFAAVPRPALVAMAALVLLLAMLRPFEAADPYHVNKMTWIAASGSLAHDPATVPKINVLNFVYELVLADVSQVPLAGDWLLRLHGIFGLALFVLALASVQELLGARPGWIWSVALVVPAVFHQFVLAKNDLLGGVPALVALAWVAARPRVTDPREVAWACWLGGFAVAVKLTNLPLLVVLGVALLWDHRLRWRPLAVAGGGVLAGLLAGGFFHTLGQNLRVYGALMPMDDQGNVNAGVVEVLVGAARFGASLLDLGLFTRAWWPGRGGWGSTFGLPFVWAVVAVAAAAVAGRRAPGTGRVLLAVSAPLLMFAATFPDADIAHRLALAPGLLLVAWAAHLVQSGHAPAFAGTAARVCVALSAAQIARSALLYLGLSL